jgi:hypothetical protein
MDERFLIEVVLCICCMLSILFIIALVLLMSIRRRLEELKYWMDALYRIYRNAVFTSLMKGNSYQ